MIDHRPTRARAAAPATVANLGPGFDVLGLCLSTPRDEVLAERTADGQVRLAGIEGDGGNLPLDAQKNCAGVAARAVLEQHGRPGDGVRLHLTKGLPAGSGLGSSAASSVAAAVATAAVICPDVPRADLLDACREGERLATGTPHPDNAAPCLLGGVVACLPGAGEAVEVIHLGAPDKLAVVTVTPDLQIPTEAGRAVMPALFPLEDVVANLARVAGLVDALGRGDLALLGRSLDDRIATPYRAGLIPGYPDVMEAARAAGALGGGISGAGPTLFALAPSHESAPPIAAAMEGAFRQAGLESVGRCGAIDPDGVVVTVEIG